MHFCDFYKAWYFQKQNASATCNAKKKNATDSSEATLQENLAAITGSNKGEHTFIKMHMCSHDPVCEHESSPHVYADIELPVAENPEFSICDCSVDLEDDHSSDDDTVNDSTKNRIKHEVESHNSSSE